MSAVTYLTPTKAPGWAQGQWPRTKERATRSSGVPAAMPSTEQVSDPNPSCPGQPIMSSPQAQRPLNPRPPLAWFKIPLVSHKTGDPAYCRKAEQRNFQPGSPQTQGYTSQPPSTKPPRKVLTEAGQVWHRCLWEAPKVPIHQAAGISSQDGLCTHQEKTPWQRQPGAHSQSTHVHACAWTPSQNTARPLGPTLSLLFQCNSNSCEVSL